MLNQKMDGGDDDVRLCQALLLKGEYRSEHSWVDLFEIAHLEVRLCLEDIKDNLPSMAGVVIRVRIDNEDFHWGKYWMRYDGSA